jgi:hypothetical protein
MQSSLIIRVSWYSGPAAESVGPKFQQFVRIAKILGLTPDLLSLDLPFTKIAGDLYAYLKFVKR